MGDYFDTEGNKYMQDSIHFKATIETGLLDLDPSPMVLSSSLYLSSPTLSSFYYIHYILFHFVISFLFSLSFYLALLSFLSFLLGVYKILMIMVQVFNGLKNDIEKKLRCRFSRFKQSQYYTKYVCSITIKESLMEMGLN